MTKTTPDFRSLIESRRVAQGLSVYALAKLADVPQPTLRDWLVAKTPSINSAALERLCGAMSIKFK